MAELLKALQDFQLPIIIEQYGGVTFDGAGQFVSAAMMSVGRGLWLSYEDCFRDGLERALHQADRNPYIKRWHANGVKKRLDAFVESGVGAQFAALEPRDAKTIVHADFSKLVFNLNKNPVVAWLIMPHLQLRTTGSIMLPPSVLQT